MQTLSIVASPLRRRLRGATNGAYQRCLGVVLPLLESRLQRMDDADPRNRSGKHGIPVTRSVVAQKHFRSATLLIQQHGRQYRPGLPGEVPGRLAAETVQRGALLPGDGTDLHSEQTRGL